MRKKFLYIKPINLVDQKEDNIIKTVPIKTKERFNYFADKSNQYLDINDNYFEIISKKKLSNNVIYQHPFDNFTKNNNVNNNNSTTRNKKKIAHLKYLYKFNSSESNGFNEKNLTSKNSNFQKLKNHKNETYSSLTLNNNNTNYQISNEETMEQILKHRKKLHNIYNQNKGISNYSYNKLSSTFTFDKNNLQEKPKETNKNNNNLKKSKNKLNNKVEKKITKNKIVKKTIKFGLYAPVSKSLRYKHYTEFRKFNNKKNKILLLNNQNQAQKGGEIPFNLNINITDMNQHFNTNYDETDINFINQSLQNHRIENEQNLEKLKKLIFIKKIDNKFINTKHEESKSYNNNQNEKMIFNEKIKKIINNERKKLEESIDDYNKQLKINLNKKDLLLKNLNKNGCLFGLTEINANKICENSEDIDNINLVTDFYFDRKNKY